MAYLEISKHYHPGAVAYWFAGGILAFKRQIDNKDYTRGHYYYAPGVAAIGIGFLLVACF